MFGKTHSTKTAEVDKKWLLIDAKGLVVGRLASIVARDRYLPRQFMNQGDRLAFSNGILVLSGLAALGVATVLGLTNGMLVGLLNLPSLAVTLGTLAAYRGLAFVILGSEGITGFPNGFTRLGNGYLGSSPFPIGVAIVAAALERLEPVVVELQLDLFVERVLKVGVNQFAHVGSVGRVGHRDPLFGRVMPLKFPRPLTGV